MRLRASLEAHLFCLYLKAWMPGFGGSCYNEASVQCGQGWVAWDRWVRWRPGNPLISLGACASLSSRSWAANPDESARLGIKSCQSVSMWGLCKFGPFVCFSTLVFRNTNLETRPSTCYSPSCFEIIQLKQNSCFPCMMVFQELTPCLLIF